MKRRYIAVFTFLFLLFCSISVGEAKAVDKKAVQGAMSAYIEAKTVEGEGSYDLRGMRIDLDYIHSGVKIKDGLYVSCADFTYGSQVFDIDYFVMEEDGNFKVVQEILHKQNGKAVNKVLWMAPKPGASDSTLENPEEK